MKLLITTRSDSAVSDITEQTHFRIKEYAKAVVGLTCTDRAKIFWKIKMLRLSSGVEDIYIKKYQVKK